MIIEWKPNERNAIRSSGHRARFDHGTTLSFISPVDVRRLPFNRGSISVLITALVRVPPSFDTLAAVCTAVKLTRGYI